MFRASFRLPRRSLLTATAASTALVLHDQPHQREKLSIYPSPTPDILLVETPSPLEQQIGVARRRATQAYRDAHAQVQGVVSSWIGVEHAIENRVKSIIAPSEPLTPGLLYVGIATLSGSILARNRMIATRLILPPAFLVLSLNQFLPKTTANLSSYLACLEETYFPTLAQKHDVANAHTRMTLERMKDATHNGRAWLNRGTLVAVEKLQDTTGLKVKEAMGWVEHQDTVKKVETKAKEVVKAVEQKVEDAKHVVEKKVDEAKHAVSKTAEPAKVEGETKSEPVKRLV